jgi:hypothetical protein
VIFATRLDFWPLIVGAETGILGIAI